MTDEEALRDTQQYPVKDARARQAHRVLYERYKGKVTRYILRMLWHFKKSYLLKLPDYELEIWAEEVSMEVFYEFLAGIITTRFRGDCSVYTWLTRHLARTRTINRMRKEIRRLRKEIPIILLREEFENFGEDLNDEDFLDQLMEKMTIEEVEESPNYEQWFMTLCQKKPLGPSKPAEHQKNCCLALTMLVQQVSIEDIARKLNRTPGATRTLMTSCRRKFKELIDNWDKIS